MARRGKTSEIRRIGINLTRMIDEQKRIAKEQLGVSWSDKDASDRIAKMLEEKKERFRLL